MSRISNISSNTAPINFCGNNGNVKIKNKYIKAMYNRKFGDNNPIRQHVPSNDSKFVKGVKGFLSALKYFLLDN